MKKRDFRWRRYLPKTAVLLILLLLPVYSYSVPQSGEGRQVAPDFTLSDINNLTYGSDGGYESNTTAPQGSAAYFQDEYGNYFRVAVSSFTGKTTVEKFVNGTGWTSKRGD